MQQTVTKLAALRDRQARLQARIERLENENKKQARKDDTHLKILIGATLLADAAHYSETDEFIRLVLSRGAFAARDREFLKKQGWIA
jgi:hypothetical protein